MTNAGKTVMKYFPDPARAKAGKTAYLEINFSLKDIDLAQLVQKSGVKLPSMLRLNCEMELPPAVLPLFTT